MNIKIIKLRRNENTKCNSCNLKLKWEDDFVYKIGILKLISSA